eukprot:556251-Amphidinium_carterae.1
MDSLAHNADVLSALLCNYLQMLADQGQPRTWGIETLAGLQHLHPCLQGQLTLAWRWQRVWNHSQVSAMRIPLPLEMVLAMAVVAHCWHRPRVAACLMLAFHCMLRPGEVANMRRRDLILPQDLHGTPWSGVVAITQSKTSTRFARMQSVIIEDDLLLQ